MKAEEVPSGKLFDSGQQLQIPIWQRRYTWDTLDWSELWKDLGHIRTTPSATHFIGSFVLKALPWRGLPSEAKRYWVVDGQQRAATLTVLVIAIRDRLARLAATDEARLMIHSDYTAQLLRNENLKAGHKDRLVPQTADASRLTQLVEGTSAELSDAPLDRAYRFFSQTIEELQAEELEELLSALLVRVMAVWVVLEDNDNAHRVFQTLNAGGKPLRQADLVRNYFFLLLGDRGDGFYNTHWRLLESDLTPRELEEFFVAWTITQGHTGGKASLFRYFQKDLASAEESATEVQDYGIRLTAAARQFQWLRKPEDCPLAEVRPILLDLRAWGTLPAEGLILLLLRIHVEGRLAEPHLAECLRFIQSFMARRLLAGFEPQLHKDIFVRQAQRLRERGQLEHAELSSYLRFLLSSQQDVRVWPSDDLVRARVSANSLYTKSRAGWVFEILKRIEKTMSNDPAGDSVDGSGYVVDHLMPDTLTTAWADDLTAWGVENPAGLHQSRLQVLGNLTMATAASPTSEASWPEARQMVIDTELAINTSMSGFSTWQGEDIDARTTELSEVACRTYTSPMTAQEVATSTFNSNGLSEEVSDVEDELEDEA